MMLLLLAPAVEMSTNLPHNDHSAKNLPQVQNLREVGDASTRVGPSSFVKMKVQPSTLDSLRLRRTLQHSAIDERGQRDVNDGIQTEPGG